MSTLLWDRCFSPSEIAHLDRKFTALSRIWKRVVRRSTGWKWFPMIWSFSSPNTINKFDEPRRTTKSILLLRMMFARLHPNEHPFRLHAYLASDESENDYLRVMTEALLLLFLPSTYSSTLVVRHLMREILVFKGEGIRMHRWWLERKPAWSSDQANDDSNLWTGLSQSNDSAHHRAVTHQQRAEGAHVHFGIELREFHRIDRKEYRSR